MRRSCYSTAFVFIAAAMLFSQGCWWGPTAIKVPPIKPQKATEAAFSQYDMSSDGVLDEKELALAPSLRDGMRSLDKDHDGRLSQEELVERLEKWLEGGVGVMPLRCVITVKGRPLGGAQVKLVPEEFLGGAIQPATGTTSSLGMARMSIDKSHLPKDMQRIPVVHQGFYRVEITHPSLQIPPKFNVESTLGLEASFERGRNIISFNL